MFRLGSFQDSIRIEVLAYTESADIANVRNRLFRVKISTAGNFADNYCLWWKGPIKDIDVYVSEVLQEHFPYSYVSENTSNRCVFPSEMKQSFRRSGRRETTALSK